jgi:peptide/nickel transport system permease protein
VGRYFARKLVTYLVTFVAAVTVDWAIPRFMPNNPIDRNLIKRFRVRDYETYLHVRSHFARAFDLDVPMWKQYLLFWRSLFQGDLGISISLFPTPVTRVIANSAPYTLSLLLPAIIVSWYVGNKVGAFAARKKKLDNSVLPVSYLLTATPYMWLATLVAWLFAFIWRLFPIGFAYDATAIPSWSFGFSLNLLYHWFLPFLTVFLVAVGGWAIGMRNMIIYELEADYSHYLESLGAPRRLVRRYAFRNALLPQVSGLALSLGAILTGALVTEIVFSYPGLGYVIYRAIDADDYFLIQGIFLFIIIGVLVANFVIDIVYVLIDPRTRVGMQGGLA